MNRTRPGIRSFRRAHPLWQVLALCVFVFFPAAARADSPDLALLASTNYDDIRRGVEALGISGDPRAAIVLGALQGGHLFAAPDHTLYIRQGDTTVNAETGAAATADGLRVVRLSNNVRVAIDAALGALRLTAPDATQRAGAAEAVFHSRDTAALPALTRAIAKETVPSVKRTMEQARAAALLSISTTSEPDRLAAIATLEDRGDMEARSLIASLADQPPAVATAAASALASIDRAQQIWSVLQSVFYGLSLGSVLLLAASGLAITFGVMGVINMAHGEMVMIGAYTTFVVQQGIRAEAPGLFGASLFIAIPAAFLVSGLIGIAIERLLIRYLYGRPLETLLATWGLSLVLQQAVRSIFGADNRDVGTPDWMSGAMQVGGLVITVNRLAIILFAVLVLAALMAVLRYTSLGLRMRAVTQTPPPPPGAWRRRWASAPPGWTR
ncbi:MAG: urea ABC transporter permease subunit UrtB [Acetobacteraceae bacterium]